MKLTKTSTAETTPPLGLQASQFMVQDLLDYSQISQKKFRENMKEFDLKKSIREVISIQQMKAERKGVELVLDLKSLDSYKIVHDEQRI